MPDRNPASFFYPLVILTEVKDIFMIEGNIEHRWLGGL